jgi:hypothetical protein
MHPYDLRHAFCSLLIGEGMSVVEVAREAGHAPTMTLATYAHVIANLDGGERVPAEASIRAAREAEVSPSGGAAACRERKPQRSQHGRSRTRTWDLFISESRGRNRCWMRAIRGQIGVEPTLRTAPGYVPVCQWCAGVRYGRTVLFGRHRSCAQLEACCSRSFGGERTICSI